MYKCASRTLTRAKRAFFMSFFAPGKPEVRQDLCCGASSGSEPSLFFSNYFFSLGFKPIQEDFQHDLARMTGEADGSVVLAELQVALFGSVIISD